MKKKIAALSAIMMLFAGVTSASSINGDYKGNPIVKITSGSKSIAADEVPSQILDGHTMVPISTLRQLGASVIWDANTYSVDVQLPNSGNTSTSNEDISINEKFAYTVEVFRYLSMMNDQSALAQSALNLSVRSSTPEQATQLQGMLNKFNITSSNTWSKQFAKFPIPESDIKALQELSTSLSTIKQHIESKKPDEAHSEWTKYKTNVNNLLASYDKSLHNQLAGKLKH